MYLHFRLTSVFVGCGFLLDDRVPVDIHVCCPLALTACGVVVEVYGLEACCGVFARFQQPVCRGYVCRVHVVAAVCEACRAMVYVAYDRRLGLYAVFCVCEVAHLVLYVPPRIRRLVHCQRLPSPSEEHRHSPHVAQHLLTLGILQTCSCPCVQCPVPYVLGVVGQHDIHSGLLREHLPAHHLHRLVVSQYLHALHLDSLKILRYHAVFPSHEVHSLDVEFVYRLVHILYDAIGLYCHSGHVAYDIGYRAVLFLLEEVHGV